MSMSTSISFLGEAYMTGRPIHMTSLSSSILSSFDGAELSRNGFSGASYVADAQHTQHTHTRHTHEHVARSEVKILLGLSLSSFWGLEGMAKRRNNIFERISTMMVHLFPRAGPKFQAGIGGRRVMAK